VDRGGTQARLHGDEVEEAAHADGARVLAVEDGAPADHVVGHDQGALA
jgi:hypothetical protein